MRNKEILQKDLVLFLIIFYISYFLILFDLLKICIINYKLFYIQCRRNLPHKKSPNEEDRRFSPGQESFNFNKILNKVNQHLHKIINKIKGRMFHSFHQH